MTVCTCKAADPHATHRARGAPTDARAASHRQARLLVVLAYAASSRTAAGTPGALETLRRRTVELANRLYRPARAQSTSPARLDHELNGVLSLVAEIERQISVCEQTGAIERASAKLLRVHTRGLSSTLLRTPEPTTTGSTQHPRK